MLCLFQARLITASPLNPVHPTPGHRVKSSRSSPVLNSLTFYLAGKRSGYQGSREYPVYIDRCFGNPSTGAGSGMISNYRGTGNFSTLLRRLLKVSVGELFEKKSLLAFKATGFPDVPSPSPECSSCQSPGSRPSHLRPVSNTSYLGTQILTPPR